MDTRSAGFNQYPLSGAPAEPRLGFLQLFPRRSSQSGGCWCLTRNSFTPVVAFCEPRIEDAICHVRGVICPLVTCKPVDHREALGGRQASVSRPSDVQLSRTWRQFADSGKNSWQSAASPQAGSPGFLLSPERLALLLGGWSGPQDRACLEWESLSVQGGRLPPASEAVGAASWGVPL